MQVGDQVSVTVDTRDINPGNAYGPSQSTTLQGQIAALENDLVTIRAGHIQLVVPAALVTVTGSQETTPIVHTETPDKFLQSRAESFIKSEQFKKMKALIDDQKEKVVNGENQVPG